MSTPPPPLAYSPAQAAHAFGQVHRSTIHELIAQGRRGAKKLGKRTLIREPNWSVCWPSCPTSLKDPGRADQPGLDAVAPELADATPVGRCEWSC